MSPPQVKNPDHSDIEFTSIGGIFTKEDIVLSPAFLKAIDEPAPKPKQKPRKSRKTPPNPNAPVIKFVPMSEMNVVIPLVPVYRKYVSIAARCLTGEDTDEES